MRYFIDAEFLENGKTIELISVGIVAEDGREYYAVSSDFSYGKLLHNDWMMENVVPSLPLSQKPEKQPNGGWMFLIDYDDPVVKKRQTIADEVRAFIAQTDRKDVELWGYYSAYDHVVLCQLFGRMIDLPANIPMFTCDLKQWAEKLDNPGLPELGEGEHNALVDARWNRVVWEFLFHLEFMSSESNQRSTTDASWQWTGESKPWWRILARRKQQRRCSHPELSRAELPQARMFYTCKNCRAHWIW